MDYIELFLNFIQTHQALFIICCVLSAVVCVVCIVAMWILFKKAGEKGWKAIVPFYNLYTLCLLVWNKKAFWEIFVFSILMLVFAALLAVFGKQADYIGIIMFVCFCVCAIWVFVDMIVLNTQIAYAFGKGNWFAVGVVFLSAVFLCILAFSKDKYVGNPTGQEIKENML